MSRKVSIFAGALSLLLMGGGSLFLAVGCGEDTPTPGKVEAPAPAPAPSRVEGPKAPEAVKPAEPAKAPEPAVEDNTPVTPVNLQDGGTVTGTVKVTNPPRRRKIRMDADPKCAAMHSEAPLEEFVVADAEGRVQYALVYVKKGLEGKKFAKPDKPAVIDQKGCRYEPHVLHVMTGQEIEIRNSDDLLHNIHALPLNNKEFNMGQPQKGMVDKRVFNTAEFNPPVKIKCDVHPWMGAWAGVFEHPFHAVTDASGKYEIKGLAAGKYTIEVWQEKYKTVSQDVEVKAGESKTADFTMTDKKGE